MALPKIYNPIIFSNDSPPELNEDNMNDMSQSLSDLDDRVISLAGDVIEKAAQIIELGENPPYVGANGNWYIWDTDTGEYVDSGIDASITITIADVSMLPSGSTPYVTNTGTSTDPIFHLFIPIAEGDYDQLTNRPKINSATLTGNKRGAQMGIVDWRDAVRQNHTMTSGIASIALKKGEIIYYVGSNPALFRLNVDVAAGGNWIQNSTAVTFEELINELTTGLSNEITTRSKLGAHNLLPNTAKTTSVNGVTFTVNADGTVTVSTGAGGATADCIFRVWTPQDHDVALMKGKRYILTGCPSGGTDWTYRISAYRIESVDGSSGTVFDTGNGVEFNWLNDGSGESTYFYINIRYDTVITTPLTFKPMLRLATDSDSTYQPYAKTNKQLTDNVTDIETAIAPIEIGTASQAYNKGDYLIMNDKLYKANTAIVSGATLIVGTNIVQTSVADELKALDVGTYDICGVMSSAYNSYIRCPIPYKRANTKHTVTLNSAKRLADATDYTSNFSVDSSQTGYFTIYSSSTALATQAMIFNVTVS